MIKKVFYSVLTVVLFLLFVCNSSALCSREYMNSFSVLVNDSTFADYTAVCKYDAIDDNGVVRNTTIYKKDSEVFAVQQFIDANGNSKYDGYFCINNSTDNYYLYSSNQNIYRGSSNNVSFYINTVKFDEAYYSKDSSIYVLDSFVSDLYNNSTCPNYAGNVNGNFVLASSDSNFTLGIYGTKVTTYAKLVENNSITPIDPQPTGDPWYDNGIGKNKQATKSLAYLLKNRTVKYDSEPTVDLKDTSNLCAHASTLKVLKIARRIVRIISILIPLVLVIFGIIEFTKALISSDQDAISKSFKSFTKKAVIGILVFFIPILVTSLVNLITGYTDKFGEDSDMYACRVCFFGDESGSINTCNDIITSLTGETYEGEDPSGEVAKHCGQISENGYKDYMISSCTKNGVLDDYCYDKYYNDTTLKESFKYRCQCENKSYLMINKTNLCRKSDGSVDTECVKKIFLFDDNSVKICKCNDSVFNGAYNDAKIQCVFSDAGYSTCINDYLNQYNESYKNACLTK